MYWITVSLIGYILWAFVIGWSAHVFYGWTHASFQKKKSGSSSEIPKFRG